MKWMKHPKQKNSNSEKWQQQTNVGKKTPAYAWKYFNTFSKSIQTNDCSQTTSLLLFCTLFFSFCIFAEITHKMIHLVYFAIRIFFGGFCGKNSTDDISNPKTFIMLILVQVYGQHCCVRQFACFRYTNAETEQYRTHRKARKSTYRWILCDNTIILPTHYWYWLAPSRSLRLQSTVSF